MDETTAVRTEPSPKRVRAYLAGHLVADTSRALLVWELPYYPSYHLPVADLHAELTPAGDRRTLHGGLEGEVHDLAVDGHVAERAAMTFDEPASLRDHVRISWRAVDRWFEEDEQVYVHPRDPYTRVDALPSSRHVVVEVDGIVIADSRRPTMLFETGLIARTYLPPTDVRLDLLAASETVTRCPYKGTSTYLHLRADGVEVDDVAWSYPFPTHESARIAGLMCFDDQKVDMIVDGERRARPDSPLVAHEPSRSGG